MKLRTGIVGFLSIWIGATIAWGGGDKPPKGYTLLVVPSKVAPIELAFDLESHNRILIMSYDPASQADRPLMHAWNGDKWVRIKYSLYTEGRFAKQVPTRTIVVGEPGDLPEELIAQASSWNPASVVLAIESTDIAAMVNDAGRLFGFSDAEWKAYAARYQLDLNDANEVVRGQNWYDKHTGSEVRRTAPITRNENAVDNTYTAPAPAPVYAPAPAPEKTSPAPAASSGGSGASDGNYSFGGSGQ